MNAPKISEVLNNGRRCICVTIPASLTRKRRRAFFKTRAEAEKFRQTSMDEAKDSGFCWALMPPAQRNKHAQLAAWLEDQGIDPMDVPRLLAKRPVIRAGVTLGKAADEFLAAKAAKGCREKYLVKLRRTVGLFLTNRRESLVSEIEVGDLEEFLGRNGYSPATRKSYRSDFGAFFAFCVRRGYRPDNPVHSTEAPILDEKPPGILTPDDARALMDAAQRHSPRVVPWIALVLFGGLRPDEARRLSWDDIRDEIVDLQAAKAKTRRRRIVPVSPQLAAWLEAGRAVGAPLPPVNWDRDWRRARQRAGISDRYEHNALRHSFASYHYARYRRASETAAIMGHSETMLFRHYREVVRESAAEVFFGLLPDRAALEAGMAEQRRPKHVPPHVLRQRRLAATTAVPGLPDPGSGVHLPP